MPQRTAPPVIRPLAAAHFRDALTATAAGDTAAAVGALLAIDSASWTAIRDRLDTLSPDLVALLTGTQGRRTP